MNRSFLAAIGRNVLALVLWYAVLWTVHRLPSAGIDSAYVIDSLSVLACLGTAWLAVRLDALVARAFIVAIAVTFGVEFLYHATFGYETVQTGPVHLAVLTAAVVGLLAGMFAFPRVPVLRSRSA